MNQMAEHLTYPNAPITEAIIDLRVELPRNVGLDRLQRLQEGEKAAYPHSEQLNVALGKMQVGPQVTTSATTRAVGFLFRSTDLKQVCQVRLDGFTMSRLTPYERWEPFRDEARRLWDVYRKAVEPCEIGRVAVRYVNRIDIPLPIGDFGEYLRTVPEVSSDLPQGLAGYFMHLVIPLSDINCLCVLNEAIVEPTAANVVSVVVDIDVFRTANLPDDEDGLWSLFEELRVRKNSVFEACITDKARELFK